MGQQGTTPDGITYFVPETNFILQCRFTLNQNCNAFYIDSFVMVAGIATIAFGNEYPIAQLAAITIDAGTVVYYGATGQTDQAMIFLGGYALGLYLPAIVKNISNFVGRNFTKLAQNFYLASRFSKLVNKTKLSTADVTAFLNKPVGNSTKEYLILEPTLGNGFIKAEQNQIAIGYVQVINNNAELVILELQTGNHVLSNKFANATAEELESAFKSLRVNGAGKVLDDIVLTMKSDFPSTWKFNKIGDDAFEVLDGTGKKWGTVYQDKIVCPARTQIGTAGNPILNKATLVKNMKYEVDGIIYQTDELGRVLKTNADLDDIARVRLGNQQIRAVDVKDGVRGVDQGGHIVGSRFFGPGEQINLYPQSANLNQGAWKTMENSWANAMVNGSDVKIEVEAVFSGISKRPDAFDVSYWIDGVKTKTSFINQ